MRSLTLLAALALACTPDTGGTDASTTSASTTDASTTGTSTTSAPTTGAVTSASTGDASTTAPTTGDGTTGDSAWCHGWDGADGEPHLSLYNNDVLLTDGGMVELECGGQGLLMFGLYPQFGGFMQTTDAINFELVVDVEGHNSNPDGHFYSTTQYGYYIGCEDPLGGQLGVVPVFPPDNEDPLLLDGLPATMHVVLESDTGSVTIDLNVTLAVDANADFEFCGQG